MPPCVTRPLPWASAVVIGLLGGDPMIVLCFDPLHAADFPPTRP